MKDLVRKRAKIGLIQVVSDMTWTVEKCHDHLLELAENCLKEGADLVFMPEAYQYKTARKVTPSKKLVELYAEPYKERCKELAAKYRAYVVPWDYEIASDGYIYNTSYILDRSGVEIGKYRKVNITYSEEFNKILKGNNYPVFDLDFGKVGIMICFDNYFPESAEILALNGAELILYPLYGDTLKPQWEIKTRARAVDNSVYIAPCHICSGRGSDITFTGMIDPEGNIVCKLTEEGSYRVIEVEMGKTVITCTTANKSQYEDIKKYLLNARNVEAYHPIVQKRERINWEEIIHKME